MKRISLRLFLFACIMVGAAVGLFAVWYQRSNRQYDVIQELRSGDYAIVMFDQMVDWDAERGKYRSNHEGNYDDVPRVGTRGYLTRWFHPDFIYEPRVLMFFNTPPQEIRKSIKNLPSVKQLVVDTELDQWSSEFPDLIIVSTEDYIR